MARHAIVEKLQPLLEKGIETEIEVVYLLVELRKLLEHDNKKDVYPVLHFYCNWVAHTKLSLSPIADEIVRLFDDMVADTVNAELNQERCQKMNDVVNIRVLLTELNTYLEGLVLPTTVCTSADDWREFRKRLGSVIQDCPLLLNARIKGNPTRFVESVLVVNQSSREYVSLSWNLNFHTKPLARIEYGRFVRPIAPPEP